MLIQNLDVRIINAATGELIRPLTIDPTRDIIKVRVVRRWGPARIGYLLGLNPSTVHRGRLGTTCCSDDSHRVRSKIGCFTFTRKW
jgi:hypothetical protein